MADASPLRIVVQSRDPLARSGLIALLGGIGGVVIVEQVEDLEEDFDLPATDVVVCDLRWGDWLEPPTLGRHRVLALVEDVDQARQARAAGALGALRRDAEEAEFEAAIRAVASGLVVSSVEFDRPVVAFADGDAPPEPLTRRETEILELVSTGLSNKAIAVRLGIRESTVKFHVNSVLAKLGAQSRTEAVIRALRAGLIRV